MKKLTFAIIIIVAILIGAPILTGKIADTQIHTLIKQLNTDPIQNGSNEILSYDRGLFSTTSLYRYTPPIQYASLLTQGFLDYQCDIDHGVISIDYFCNIVNNVEYTNFINESLNGKDPLSMNGKVSAFNGLTNTLSVDEINDLQLQGDNTSLSFAKTEITITTDKNLSNYAIHGESPRFKLTSGTESMSIDQIELGGDIEALEGGLYTGDINLTIDNVELADVDKRVAIQGFKSTTRADQNDGNIDSRTNVSINHMTLANSPFNILEDLAFELSVNGLNKQALIDYQAFSKKLQNQMLNANTPSSDINPMEMVPVIESMLVKDFNIGFNLSGDLDSRSNSSKLSINLLESLAMTDAMAMVYAPQETLNKLNISFINSFHAETVNADPKLAASVLNSPLFEQSSDRYNMTIKLGSENQLNGEPISIEELQALVMTSVQQQQAIQ